MVGPESIPRIPGDMVALAGHANAIAAAGFVATGERVHSGWQALAAVYVAREAGRLFAFGTTATDLTASYRRR